MVRQRQEDSEAESDGGGPIPAPRIPRRRGRRRAGRTGRPRRRPRLLWDTPPSTCRETGLGSSLSRAVVAPRHLAGARTLWDGNASRFRVLGIESTEPKPGLAWTRDGVREWATTNCIENSSEYSRMTREKSKDGRASGASGARGAKYTHEAGPQCDSWG